VRLFANQQGAVLLVRSNRNNTKSHG
jgi:hypothetical protein